jgi:hypothetical protein
MKLKYVQIDFQCETHKSRSGEAKS